MKKTYTAPELDVLTITANDIKTTGDSDFNLNDEDSLIGNN